MSTASATARGLSAQVAPFARCRDAAWRDRSCTTSWCPAFCRLLAIPAPIMPSPMNPICIAVPPVELSVPSLIRAARLLKPRTRSRTGACRCCAVRCRDASHPDADHRIRPRLQRLERDEIAVAAAADSRVQQILSERSAITLTATRSSTSTSSITGSAERVSWHQPYSWPLRTPSISPRSAAARWRDSSVGSVRSCRAAGRAIHRSHGMSQNRMMASTKSRGDRQGLLIAQQQIWTLELADERHQCGLVRDVTSRSARIGSWYSESDVRDRHRDGITKRDDQSGLVEQSQLAGIERPPQHRVLEAPG